MVQKNKNIYANESINKGKQLADFINYKT